jgi:hypothetical protein
MPRSKEFLLEQIARAGPLRAAMNTEADRERFEKMAADLRTELDAAEAAENQASAATTASEDADPAAADASAQLGAGGSDAAASAPDSTDEQKPATDLRTALR